MRHFRLRLDQLHKSENQALTKTDRRLEQLHRIALSTNVLTMIYFGTGNRSDGKTSDRKGL